MSYYIPNTLGITVLHNTFEMCMFEACLPVGLLDLVYGRTAHSHCATLHLSAIA